MDAPTLSASLAFISGAAVFGVRAWNWTSRQRLKNLLDQELARRQPELEDSYTLRQHNPEEWTVGTGSGEVGIIDLGTYASRQSPRMLDMFECVGAEKYLGGRLIIELSKAERDICLNAIPERLHPRITVAACRNLPGGLHGRTLEEAQAIKHLWYHDIVQAMQKWIRYLEAHDQHELLIIVVSPGGHAALLQTVLEEYHRRFPDKPVYILTILDEIDVIRERFPLMRQLIAQSGVVRGTLITDNRRWRERSDLGVAMLLAAMTASGWVGNLPTQIGNVLAQIFATHRAVRYATLSVTAEEIPVKYFAAYETVQEVYYAKANLIEEKITRNIKSIMARPDLQSVPLEGAASGHVRVLYVIAPLIPSDFDILIKRLDDNLKEWREKNYPDLQIKYTSIGHRLSETTEVTPIVFVLVQPLADHGSELDALARGEHPIGPKYLRELPAPETQQQLLLDDEAPVAQTRRGRPPRSNDQSER